MWKLPARTILALLLLLIGCRMLLVSGQDIPARVQAIEKMRHAIDESCEQVLPEEYELRETTESGYAYIYRLDDTFIKIYVRRFGETFQYTGEYYARNGSLFFVREMTVHYNRPLYWDSTAMRNNGDDQVFDWNKAQNTTVLSYLENGNIFYQHDHTDCGAPFADDYLKRESSRLREEYRKLLLQPEGNRTSGN